MEFAQEITGPIAVIGDVHGQLEQLRCVLDQLAELPDFENRWVVYIGDLVDRGPDPKGALDLILERMKDHPKTTFVCGNHEFAMASALKIIETPDYCDWPARWLDHYGCQSTFRSYGLNGDEGLETLRAQLPESHVDFLSNIPWCVEHPEYFFVHAGLDPSTSFELQRAILHERDYTLTRPQWLCSKGITFRPPPRDCERVVVSGHVQVPHVTYGPKRILIDTSGGTGGTLSCVLLPENKVIHSDLNTEPQTTTLQPPEAKSPRKRSWFWGKSN